MTVKLFFEALFKYIIGLAMMILLIFLPAGTFNYWNGWLLIGLLFIPILIVTIVFTFGVCTIMMHFGVFAEDLSNLVNIALRMVFYLTGIFFDISTKVHNVLYRTILLDLNPLANFIFNMRNVLIYSSSPVGMWTLIWFFVGILLSMIGINTIYKYENTYVKVMR